MSEVCKQFFTPRLRIRHYCKNNFNEEHNLKMSALTTSTWQFALHTITKATVQTTSNEACKFAQFKRLIQFGLNISQKFF